MEKEYIHSFLRLVSTHRITVASDKYTTETGWCQVYEKYLAIATYLQMYLAVTFLTFDLYLKSSSLMKI